MASGNAQPATLSPAEVAEAIRALPEVGWYRLDRVARLYARTCRLEADDLLQEVFARALSDSRRCPRSVDVVRFLAGAMRSIASDSVKARRREAGGQAELHLVNVVQDEAPPGTPEAELVGEEEAARIKRAILALFSDDVIAQMIIEGGMEGMDAEEIRTLVDLDKVGYASKRRLIRRRIDKAYPDGWKP